MASHRLAMMLVLSSAVAWPGHAQVAPGLPPASPWNLVYDDDSCALRRTFGEGDRRAYLEIRRFGPGAGLQAIVASNWMTARSPAQVKYRFGEDGEWRDARGNGLVMADGFSGVLFMPTLVDLPDPDEIEDPLQRESYLRSIDWRERETAAAAGIRAITLRGGFRNALTLQLPSLEGPIAALNQCVDELMTHWGIDVEAHKTLTRPAVPTNLPEVPRMIDYPPKMVRQGLPGVVNIRLAIDETGGIAACHIQMPLSDPAFEQTSCADIQHALEFDPALDKDGKPIASYWVTKVVFQIGR